MAANVFFQPAKKGAGKFSTSCNLRRLEGAAGYRLYFWMAQLGDSSPAALTRSPGQWIEQPGVFASENRYLWPCEGTWKMAILSGPAEAGLQGTLNEDGLCGFAKRDPGGRPVLFAGGR